MADNIVTAHLRPGGVTTTRPLYQYDYGQILQFTGQVLPAAYEVHSANAGDFISRADWETICRIVHKYENVG